MKRLPPTNTLCECRWVDITGSINSPLSECRPVKCTTIGKLAIKNEDYIVLVTSRYEGDDDCVDATAIPLGVVESCKRLSQ